MNRLALKSIYLGPDFISFELKLVVWERQPLFQIWGLQIQPRETTHLTSLSKKFGNARFKSYSLRVEHPDFRVVFSADLVSPTDLEVQLA